MTAGEVIGRVAEVGGRLQLDGERVQLSLPWDCPPETASAILKTVRANHDAVAAREMGRLSFL